MQVAGQASVKRWTDLCVPRDGALIFNAMVAQKGPCVLVHKAHRRIALPLLGTVVPFHTPHVARVSGSVIAEAADLHARRSEHRTGWGTKTGEIVTTL